MRSLREILFLAKLLRIWVFLSIFFESLSIFLLPSLVRFWYSNVLKKVWIQAVKKQKMLLFLHGIPLFRLFSGAFFWSTIGAIVLMFLVRPKWFAVSCRTWTKPISPLCQQILLNVTLAFDHSLKSSMWNLKVSVFRGCRVISGALGLSSGTESSECHPSRSTKNHKINLVQSQKCRKVTLVRVSRGLADIFLCWHLSLETLFH